ncbi:Cytochrome c1 [Diplonema papillatum]|nr:Cytochrome c1 [Diplonema papillatum]
MAMTPAELELHAPRFPWFHKSILHYSYPRKEFLHGHDWPSIRRGRQVYTEVFAPCHSLDMLSFRHLQEFMTVEEVKALAAENECDAAPDSEGVINQRPCTILDKLPQPYANEEAAKNMNGGAKPPDLSLITKGRDGGEHYVFSLLTSYNRPIPEGLVSPGATLFWNPYFSGCWIGMPPPLSDEMVEYEDGTPASTSQMAKDVCCFLSWCAEPWMDERKYTTMKMTISMAALIPFTLFWYRSRYNLVKFRRIRQYKVGKL